MEVVKDKIKQAHESVIVGWQDFYKQVFGMSVDFSGIYIPEAVKSFVRILIITQGLTLEQAWEVCTKLFKVSGTYGYDTSDPRREIVCTQRNTASSYAISVQNYQNTDNQFAYHSAKDMENTIVIDLLERLIFEIKYFWENRDKRDRSLRHLDSKGLATICGGCRTKAGLVPVVRYNFALEIFYRDPRQRTFDDRIRPVIQ